MPMVPPFELVQLSTLPEKFWLGLPVFHPCEQIGNEPKWTDPDIDLYPEDFIDEQGIPIDPVAYDVGSVIGWGPDEHFPEVTRVHFLTGHGYSLRYGSWNLWVPKALADNLKN